MSFQEIIAVLTQEQREHLFKARNQQELLTAFHEIGIKFTDQEIEEITSMFGPEGLRELTDDDMLEVAGRGKKYLECNQWCESPDVYNLSGVTYVFCSFLKGYYIPYMLPCGKWDKDDILE